MLSGGKVQVRELIWLEIELPDHRLLHFWAEVVDEASEIGFAVKFNSSSEVDQQTSLQLHRGSIRVATDQERT